MPAAYLVDCPTCGNPTASTAAACPKCGCPHPAREARNASRGGALGWYKSQGTATRIVLGLLAFIVVGNLATCGNDAPAPVALRSSADAESTRAADSLAEAGAYAAAQALPASDVEGNRSAYADLASRYPSSPEYARKRDQYAGQIESQSRQAAARTAAAARSRVNRSATGSRSQYIRGSRGGCYYLNGRGKKVYVDHSLCG